MTLTIRLSLSNDLYDKDELRGEVAEALVGLAKHIVLTEHLEMSVRLRDSDGRFCGEAIILPD